MRFLILISIITLVSCSRHTPAPVSEVNQSSHDSKNKRFHQSKKVKKNKGYTIVKKGDSLYSIGFNNNIDFKTLASINNIAAPYRIYPGQKIKFKSAKKSKKVRTHALKKSKKINVNSADNVIKNNTKNHMIVKKPKVATIKSSVNKTNIKKYKSPLNNSSKTKPKVSTTQKHNTNTAAPQSNSRWIWPVNGKIISTFSQSNTSRKGIDIATGIGHSVVASNNGIVVYSGDGLRGYGELVILKHSNNLLSAYAHNSNRLVKEGQSVKQGQIIAKSGKDVDGKALLHFEIRKNGQPVNPLKYLPKN